MKAQLKKMKDKINELFPKAKSNLMSNEEFLNFRILQENYERELFLEFCNMKGIKVLRFSKEGTFQFWDAFVVSGDTRILCEIKVREYDSDRFESTMLGKPKFNKFISYKENYPQNEIFCFSFWNDGVCTEHNLNECEYLVKKRRLINETKGSYHKKDKFIALFKNKDAQKTIYSDEYYNQKNKHAKNSYNN